MLDLHVRPLLYSYESNRRYRPSPKGMDVSLPGFPSSLVRVQSDLGFTHRQASPQFTYYPSAMGIECHSGLRPLHMGIRV